MGQGSVDWEQYFKIWREKCPQVPVQLEIISQWGTAFKPKEDKDFWKPYKSIRDEDYQAFLAFSKRWKGEAPKPHPHRTSHDFMKKDLERSLKFCRENLGLGIRS